MIGFLNGDLSGQVGNLWFSAVVVEGDVEIEWMDTGNNGFPGLVWYCTCWLSVLYCLLMSMFQVSCIRNRYPLIRYDYGWIIGVGVFV